MDQTFAGQQDGYIVRINFHIVQSSIKLGSYSKNNIFIDSKIGLGYKKNGYAVQSECWNCSK